MVSHTSQKYLHLKGVPRLRLQSKGVCKGGTQDTDREVVWEGGGWRSGRDLGQGGSHPELSNHSREQLTLVSSTLLHMCPMTRLGHSEWRLRFMPYSRWLLQFLGFGPGNVWNGAVAANGSPVLLWLRNHKHSLQALKVYLYTQLTGLTLTLLHFCATLSHSWWRSQRI